MKETRVVIPTVVGEVEIAVDEQGCVSIMGSGDVRVHFPFKIGANGELYLERPGLDKGHLHDGLTFHIQPDGVPGKRPDGMGVAIKRNCGFPLVRPWFTMAMCPRLRVNFDPHTLSTEQIQVLGFAGDSHEPVLLGSQPISVSEKKTA